LTKKHEQKIEIKEVEGTIKERKKRRQMTEEEERRILGFLMEGRNCNQVSKIIGRDRMTVARIATEHKIEISKVLEQKLKNLDVADGLNAYNRYLKSEERQKILSATLDKIHSRLSAEAIPAKDIRDLAVSMGIVIDKFAVEAGKTDANAKNALIAMFQKMEQNNTQNNNFAAPSSEPVRSEERAKGELDAEFEEVGSKDAGSDAGR
jgi:hypothetical protein